MTEHSQPSRSEHRPLNAEDLRRLIQLGLSEHAAVVSCRPTHTIFRDRIALTIEDRAGALWRVHVLTEPRR